MSYQPGARQTSPLRLRGLSVESPKPYWQRVEDFPPRPSVERIAMAIGISRGFDDDMEASRYKYDVTLKAVDGWEQYDTDQQDEPDRRRSQAMVAGPWGDRT